MLSEIELEALRCFTRNELEGLQMHSRYLRDVVNRHAHSLPLRYIHSVHVKYGDVDIQLVDVHCTDGLLDHYEDVIRVIAREQEMGKLFRCVNNAFIHRLTIGFHLEDLPLPYYLRANSNDLQCHIGALRIADTGSDEEGHARAVGIDYALVDFLGVQLKPHTYETRTGDELREDYAMLSTHDALRGSVKHVVYEFYDGVAVPDCILAALFGVDIVETCAIETLIDPRPWIGRFVGMFKMAARGTDIARSVTLLHLRVDEPPSRLAVEPLGRPLRTDAPIPHSAFLKEWSQELLSSGNTATAAAVAELFEFENATSSKKLKLFVWTVEQGYEYEGTAHLDFVHYAFQLQVVDM